MKSSTTLTTISLAALLAGFAAIGCGGAEVEPTDQSQRAALTQPGAEAVQPPQGKGHEARGEHHRGKRGFGPPSAEKMMEKLDANENGALEAAELPERMQEHIADFDKSGDGIVSKDELEAQLKAKHAEHAAKFAERAKARFEKKDANKDGMLDANELGSDRWSKLSVADANGDQRLTPDELKAAFQAGKIMPPMKHGKHRRHLEHAEPAAPPAAAPATPAL
jgi:EF hand